MKKCFLLLVMLFILKFGYSQHVDFSQSYSGQFGLGQFVYSFICDSTLGGNYLLVGGESSSFSSQYLYGVIDRQGNVLWQKDSAVIDTSNGMHDASFSNGRRTLDNGFIFCGAVTDFSISNTERIFILKTDSLGNEIWRKSIAKFRRGGAAGIYLAPDSSLLFSGYIQDTASNLFHPYLLKLNSVGDYLFMIEYSLDASNIKNILRINDRFYICGSFSQVDTFTQQRKFGYFILSTDTSGSYLGSQVYTDSINSLQVGNFVQTIDGNLLFTFTERDSTGGGSVRLLKIDTLANVLWQTTLANQPFISSSVCQFPNGEIISSYGNNKLEKFDSFGNSLWIADLAALPTQNFSTFETRSIFPVNNYAFLISSSESVSAPGGSWLTITKVIDTTLTTIL